MREPANAAARACFNELHAHTCEPLRRYVRRVLGDADRTDDIVQDAFVRALASDNLPADRQQARAYIFRIASNLIKDEWRRRRRELASQFELMTPAVAEDAGLRVDIERVFVTLTLRERQLIWLAYVEGLDHAAIATALGVGKSSVKVLLFRARERFARLLGRRNYAQT